MPRPNQEFQTVRSEGGLLPPDLLRRLLDRHSALAGTRPEDYGLSPGERVNEVITHSWNRLRRHYGEFRAAAANVPEGEAATGLTNDKWSLPLLRELGFGFLPASAGPEIGGRTYAIRRFFGPVAVHLVGRGLSLDRRAAGQRGAAAANPHGLVQEFLNRSDAHLWAIVSNGLRLRILRDNQALSRQSYIEFDLEAMFAGEVYSDLVLLWLVVHASRFVPREGERPETCWLEQWTHEAEQQGARALGELRGGVERALRILGRGFTSHPRNAALRERLRTGALSPDGLHGQHLRVVYRLIFLFVAEDRTLDGQSLLHPRDDSDGARAAREAYAAHYGTARLRHLAGRIKGSRHGDLWRQFRLLADALSGEPDLENARRRLALPALGSFLWSPESTPELNDAELTNHDFLEALRHLAFTRQNKVLRPVDYRNLGTEELGGVYEGLLALTPQVSGDGADFTFAEFAGNARKTSGSYYTPDSLVQCLLDSALGPVVVEAVRGKTGADAERAILDLKVCDPAVGSGHFLVGAAHRLARHLARVRAHAAGESEPSPLLYQHALRDVIGRCLYGVDMNPMAAELCRVSLWLEALEPGKPLSFLDHHIRVGNSLLGATPELIEAGLPDEAFKPQQGDDRKICTGLRRRNKAERESGQQDMGYLMVAEPSAEYDTLGSRIRWIDESPDDTLDEVRGKEAQFRRLVVTGEYRQRQLVADAWCAAFVQPKGVGAGRDPALCITTDTLRGLEANSEALAPAQRREVERLAREYQFFHWHLAFPEVFEGGGVCGFDCVLGNPPWERVKLQEKEWFAERSPEIADAPNAAARKRMIRALAEDDPELYRAFLDALRQSEWWSHLMRNSGRYPLCARGDINSYAVFAEGMRSVLNDRGRVGCVLPTGIATDDTTKFFFQDVVGTKSLVSLFDFENKGVFFPGVHSSYKFCLVTADGGAQPAADHAEYVFFAHAVDELRDPERRFTLSPEDIALLNPNTRTCPTFRSRSDAELAKAIHGRVPVLIREARDDQPEDNPWGIRFSTMFHMANDSHLFHTRDQLEGDGWELSGNVFRKDGMEYLPLYEAKMTQIYNHRAADVVVSDRARQRKAQPSTLGTEELIEPYRCAMPLYWVDEQECVRAMAHRWDRHWLLGFSNVTSPTNERTMNPVVVPRNGVGHSMSIVLGAQGASDVPVLYANLCAFVFDYAVRQKIGGVNLSFFLLNQCPVLSVKRLDEMCPWDSSQSVRNWITPRVLELSYTAWDLEPFAADCGWNGPPFHWDDDRRFPLRWELDAAFFHLYLPAEEEAHWRPARRSADCPRDETLEQLAQLTRRFPTPRDAVAYIMDTFSIVRRKDEGKHHEYRTKRAILQIYDEMEQAIRTGTPYRTRLNPQQADPSRCHSRLTNRRAFPVSAHVAEHWNHS